MNVRLCSTNKADGTLCRAVASAGHRLCHYHKELDQRSRRRCRALRPPAIRLGPLADRPAIQRAFNRIYRAHLNGSLPPDRATTLINRICLAYNSLPGEHRHTAAWPDPF